MPDIATGVRTPELDELLAEQAPWLFAVIEVDEDRPDGEIAAWGMAFADGVEACTTDGGGWFSFSSPERLLWLFNLNDRITAHLLWLHPATGDYPAINPDGFDR